MILLHDVKVTANQMEVGGLTARRQIDNGFQRDWSYKEPAKPKVIKIKGKSKGLITVLTRRLNNAKK